MPPGPSSLTGHGVVLRPWQDGDLDTMVELFDDPDVARYTPLPSPFTRSSAEQRLQRARAGEALLFALTTDGGRALGEAMLAPDKASLGYAVGAQHRGWGLARRAVALLRDHAHEVLALPVVRLEIDPENLASAVVARAAGFVLRTPAASMVEDKGRRYPLDLWEHSA